MCRSVGSCNHGMAFHIVVCTAVVIHFLKSLKQPLKILLYSCECKKGVVIMCFMTIFCCCDDVYEILNLFLTRKRVEKIFR